MRPVQCLLDSRLAPFALIVALGVAAGPARAAGDMLQPNEVPTTGISANPANDSGLFIGGGLGFGQARSTEGDGAGGLAYTASFEPGYQVNTGSWSRLEFSGQLLTGRAAFRVAEERGGKVTMPISFGALVKAGYGYSLGSKLFGIARLGVGPVQARWEGKVEDEKYKSTSALNGIAGLLAWDMVAPMTSSLDVVGGFTWMHMQFDLDKVKDGGGNTLDTDQSVIVNVPQITVGLRARL